MPPLTGLVGMYGAEISHAGQIACDEVNESGGVLGRPLELVIEDDGSLPESAVAAAAKLVDQHRCVAIIGNLLSNSRIAVAYEVAEPRRMPYLNFSFYEGSILSHYFFHFAALPNQQIDRMIPYMHKQYGPRMFFAGNNYEWPRGSIDAAKRALEQSGGEVIGEAYYPLGVGNGDIEGLLDQLDKSDADVFVPYFAGADQIQLLTRFTERGLKSRMAVVMGHYDEVMSSRLPPEVREGFYSSNTYFMTLATPENSAYLERLSTQPGVNGVWPLGNGILTNFGEGAYLCVKAFAKAANQAGSLEPEALVNALETIDVSGPQGAVQMDPVTHHAKVNTYLSRCRADGSFAIIERFGVISPVLPERYRHLRISRQSLQEDIYLQSRMIAQMTEAVLLVHARDGVIVYTNPGTERMFGYGPGELAGKFFSVLFARTDDSAGEITASIGATLSKKGVWQGQTENIARDGKRFWCAASASVFTHPKYGEVWMILNKDITERKRVEEQLRSALQYARSLIEASLDPLVTISAEGKITDVNEATAQATGVSREALVGSDFSDYFTEPDKARAGYQEVFAKGAVTDYPLTLRHASGNVMDVLYNASVYRNDKNDVAGVFAAARDISERKKAGQEVLQLSLRNQSILDSAGEGIYGLDTNDRCTFINPAASQLLGFTVDELVGQHTHSMFHHTRPDGSPYPQEECPVLAAYQQGVTHRGVDMYWRKDGSRFPVEFVSTPIRDGGKITGAVVAFSDITERKLLEREREQYFKFFRLSIDPMCIADPYGCFKQVNPAFVLLTGYDESELVAKPFLDFILPEDRQKTADEMKLQVAVRPSMNFENRYVCKDGKAITLSWTAYYDKNDGGTYATARDISERKRAEEELRKYHEHLEELVRERTAKLEVANKDLEGFAYSVSHDLRVPLRAIDGFSQQILKRYEDKLDSEGKRYLNIVRDNTKRMSRLIDDILAFSRMGRLGMSVSETDMEGLVREVFEELKAGLAGRELALTVNALPLCHGDPAMLRQVWQNLLGNAIKFTRPKALALVEVGGYTEGADMIYYVKDNGAGFDMQYADKLFGVFQRLHGIEEFDGTGIGLAIVKRIITRHGGRVWAEGKVDEGATFYFSLPI